MLTIKTFGSGSAGNCYHISDGETDILLECGLPWKEIRQKMNFDTSRIKAVLITHEHGDHCKGLKGALAAGKNVYMSEGTKDALNVEHHRLNSVTVGKQLRIGSFMIMPFETEHDVNEPVGFLLSTKTGDNLLFATDTYFIRHRFKGLTHIMLEVNYSLPIVDNHIANGRIPYAMKKRLVKSHMSLENAIQFFKNQDLSKVEFIYLLHLSDTNSHKEDFIKAVQRETGKIVYAASK